MAQELGLIGQRRERYFGRSGNQRFLARDRVNWQRRGSRRRANSSFFKHENARLTRALPFG
jgi:hypothetical protein